MQIVLYLFFVQIYVDSSAPINGDGNSWNTAHQSLNPALAQAVGLGGAEIRIAQGTFIPEFQQGYVLASNITIRGGYSGRSTPDPDLYDPAAFPTIFDGDILQNDDPDLLNTLEDNTAHMFRIESSNNVVIEGLWLEHFQLANSDNHFMYRGTVITARQSSVSLSEIRFGKSYADLSGSYVFAFESTMSISNCRMESMHRGASAYVYAEGSQLEIQVCYFGPADIVGGGLSIQGGSLKIDHSYFEGINSTLGASQGGAIEARLAEVNIRGVTSRQCFANDGGAFFLEDCTGDIVHCLFVENHSSADTGGAITQNGGQLNIALCRFFSNLGEIALGGGFALVSGQAKIVGCLFVRNMTSLDFPPTTFNPGSGVACTSEGNLGLSLVTLYGHPLFEPGGTVASVWGHIEIDRSIIWSDETQPGVVDSQLLGQWPAPTAGTLNLTRSTVEGWNASVPGSQISDVRPLFTNPLGSDGILGTPDDNLRPGPSPSMQTDATNLPLDWADVDEDGDRNELMIWDLDGYLRFPFGSPSFQKGAYQPRAQGDWDADQNISVLDFIHVQGVFGPCPALPYPCPGDWNNDSQIDQLDMLWPIWN